MNWYVYIVECSDTSLYTGIATDVAKRVKTHNKKKGSKSLLGKLPVTLLFTEIHTNRSSASKREWEIKQWGREKKLELIKQLKKLDSNKF